MPLHSVTIPNPYADGDLSDRWAYCSRAYFDWTAKTLYLRYEVYTGQAAADAGKPPRAKREYYLKPDEFLPLLAANAATYVALATVLDSLVAVVEPAAVSPPTGA